MEKLPNYDVGGTVHVVINNQVGFTTTPDRARSTVYCSDVATAINAPIFHVNAQSMDDVAKVFRIAAEYRQKFQTDVVIDLVGYRKMGHNELDQPMFTQPLMYKIVSQMNPVRNIYRQQLIDQGISEEKLAKIDSETVSELENAYTKSKNMEFETEEWKSEKWEVIENPQNYGAHKNTGINVDHLREVGLKIARLPEGKKFHNSIAKIFKAREKSI